MSKRFTQPEWLKLQDGSGYSSLSVTELFRVCITEEVESVHIVKPGKRKGVRLINKKSLDDYIRSFLPGGSRFQKSQRAPVPRDDPESVPKALSESGNSEGEKKPRRLT